MKYAKPDSDKTPLRPLGRGFSLVELMVAVVLAAIIFAGLLPVFLTAARSVAADRARSQAAALAQERIERIRELEFDEILDDGQHLRSDTFAGGAFGTQWKSQDGPTFTVDYTVEVLPSADNPVYKRVGVTVGWSPPPAPVRSVTMWTIVADPDASAWAGGSVSPSPSASPSPSPSPSAGSYRLTVLVTANHVNPSTGVTVVRTDVTPSVTMLPSPQFPTTQTPAVWNGLPPGTYLLTCNYYRNGKANQPRTLQQTVTISNADVTYTFDIN